MRMLEQNLAPLPEQQVLVTTELSPDHTLVFTWILSGWEQNAASCFMLLLLLLGLP